MINNSNINNEKSKLQVYVRIKPSQAQQIQYEISEDQSQIVISSRPLLSSAASYSLNYRDTGCFNFKQIIDQDSEQDSIYETVALPVLQNFINGYNGTIFAYGQTGSGKTYTMSGSEQQQWQYRGIIPRVISGVFDEIEKKAGFDCRVFVSYMEIYNDNAYDLLDQTHLEEPPENWNKVQFQWDDEGNIHLKNISFHTIANEQEGFDKMITGNFIKKMSSTPINYNSSRSHCVFTINLEATEESTGDQYLSKLHLVDLAGSERISKKQVIVALNDQKKKGLRTHIPYRNSIMTTVLKDSLGGNCLTVMIANISSELENYDETISTLRFSQRVSMVENEVHKNQKFDISKAYKQLQAENLALQKRLDEYESQDRHPPPVNYSEIDGKTAEELEQKVGQFLDESSNYIYIRDIAEAQLCFQAMKQLYNKTMQEYVDELQLISGKLEKYKVLLKQKKQRTTERQQENLNGSQEEQRSSQQGSQSQDENQIKSALQENNNAVNNMQITGQLNGVVKNNGIRQMAAMTTITPPIQQQKESQQIQQFQPQQQQQQQQANDQKPVGLISNAPTLYQQLQEKSKAAGFNKGKDDQEQPLIFNLYKQTLAQQQNNNNKQF